MGGKLALHRLSRPGTLKSALKGCHWTGGLWANEQQVFERLKQRIGMPAVGRTTCGG